VADHPLAPPATFPVLLSPRLRREYPGCPRAVPWALVGPHEAQAARNHHQSLRQLAARGGLDPLELLAVVSDVPYPAEQVQAAGESALAHAIRDIARRVARLAAPGAPAEAAPAWAWACPVCATRNVADPAPGGGPPRAAECTFCRGAYALRVGPGADDPTGEAGGDTTDEQRRGPAPADEQDGPGAPREEDPADRRAT